MVTVSLPPADGQLIQQYYVQWNEGSTGCALLLGPFYMDRDGKTVDLVTTELNFGSPIRPAGEDSIAGQNPVKHVNAHGNVTLSRVTLDSDDAFLKEVPSPESDRIGTAFVMSDAVSFGSYGNAYKGYFPQGNSRAYAPGYWGYTHYRGMVQVDRMADSYQAYGCYAGIGDHVTGHSKYGYIRQNGWWYEVRRVVTFIGAPYRNSEDRWVRKANMVEDATTHLESGEIETRHGSYDGEHYLIFTSPLFMWTSFLRKLVLDQLLNRITVSQLRLFEPEDIFGTLVKEAVQSIRYISSNTIENLSDLRDVSSIAPPIKSIKKLVKCKDPRALADIYLWYKYALQPALSDIPELINTIAKSKKRYTGNFYRGSMKTRTYVTMGLTQTCESRVGVQFSVDPAFKAKMMMQSWGVDPSLSNAWDLVPFSFVVDWFAHVGDTLSNLDYEIDIFCNTYDFEFINCSNKITADVPDLTDFIGDITVTYYHRWPLRSVPFTYDRQPSDVSSHILEGAALIVTK